MTASPIPPNALRVFTVEWDSTQRKFIAFNDGREPLGSTTDRANAIGIAIRNANMISRAGGYVAVKVLLHTGKYRTEYITQPGLDRN
jgi:hypothetical protein